MRHWAYILLLGFCSCQSTQDKFIQTEFDKIQGTWVVDTFSIPSTAPDTLNFFFKKGAFLFNSCTYYRKSFTKSGAACNGEAEINDVIISTFYSYSYSTGLFNWQLSYVDKNNFRYGASKATQLFDGNWEVVIDGNKMSAKRKGVDKPYLDQATLYKGEVTFTATRK